MVSLSNHPAKQVGQQVASLQEKVEFLRCLQVFQFNLFLLPPPPGIVEVAGKSVIVFRA